MTTPSCPSGSNAQQLLFLGDSYTSAEGIEHEEGWPYQLVRSLDAQGQIESQLTIRAANGWTAAELQQSLQDDPINGEWHQVFLCVGVNNQYREQSLEDFRVECRALMHWVKDRYVGTQTQVLVLSIPDWGASPFAQDQDRASVAASVDLFNGVVADEATAMKWPFLNWTDLSRELATEANMFASDGLHPSAEQYEAWAKLVQAWLSA